MRAGMRTLGWTTGAIAVGLLWACSDDPGTLGRDASAARDGASSGGDDATVSPGDDAGVSPGDDAGLSPGDDAGSGLPDAGDTFVTPDLLDNASFETGWDGFTDWSGGTPSGVTRDDTTAADGSWSVLRTWAPNPSVEGGAQFAYQWGGGYDRIWMRFYLKLTAHITSIMKFARWSDPGFGTNLGGLFLEQGDRIISFGFDEEDMAITDVDRAHRGPGDRWKLALARDGVLA